MRNAETLAFIMYYLHNVPFLKFIKDFKSLNPGSHPQPKLSIKILDGKKIQSGASASDIKSLN